MNLVYGKWIPVLRDNGGIDSVSLQEIFKDGESIVDLVLNPVQRISVMRLLICITQASLDGPNDTEDWLRCKEKIIPAVGEYLHNYQYRFNLHDEKHPFLQVKNCLHTKNTSNDKFAFYLAAGNNATLFDHEACAINKKRSYSDAELALMILSYQNFSPGGLIGINEWTGNPTGKNSENAPCIENSPLHTFIKGKNLLESVWLNLINKKIIAQLPNTFFGRPIWEYDLNLGYNDLLKQKVNFSYLGSLVPLSRLIYIEDEYESTLGNGLSYPSLPESRNPFLTVIEKKKSGKNIPGYLRISLDKHPWRSLASMLTFGHNSLQGGSLPLRQIGILSEYTSIEHIDVWTGGMVADKAKLIDMVEWIISIPILLVNSNELELYQTGVDYAENGSNTLGKVIKDYCKELGIDHNPFMPKAKTFFWHKMDNDSQLLIDLISELKNLDEWYNLVHKNMFDAFDYTCPKDTPRQLKAFSITKKKLYVKPHK